MNRFLWIIAALLLYNVSVLSQDDWTLFKKSEKKPNDTIHKIKHDSIKELNYELPDGKVVIHQNSEIDSLIRKIGKAPFINGYTVQIEVSQQKAVIRDSRYKFLKKYPDVPLDDDYNAPNTYLYGGRFYDRSSAVEFKHKISDYFPNAIVIQKKMDLPPIQKEIEKTN